MSGFEIIEVGPGGVICNELSHGCKCHLTAGHDGDHIAVGSYIITWKSGGGATVKLVIPE